MDLDGVRVVLDERVADSWGTGYDIIKIDRRIAESSQLVRKPNLIIQQRMAEMLEISHGKCGTLEN